MESTDNSSEVKMETDSDELYVDEEGDWYYQDSKIIRDGIIELFMDNMYLDPGGGFLIQREQSRCFLKTADTPFVIYRVDRMMSGDAQSEQIVMRLKHLSKCEILDAATLFVGKHNALYCRIRDGRFPARFSRPAYYQLAEWVQEDPESGEFYIELNGNVYVIRGRGL
jgi:hypothetical protein